MDSVGLNVSPVSPAHLAEGMFVEERSSDSFPVRTVSPLSSRVSFDAVVSSHHEALMLLAVSSVGEVGAAGVGAGTLGFPWHPYLLGKGKPGSSPGLLCISVSIVSHGIHTAIN